MILQQSWDWLQWLVVATYLWQGAGLIWCSAPSPVATGRLLAGRKLEGQSGAARDWFTAMPAGTALLLALTPLTAFLVPEVGSWLGRFPLPSWTRLLAALCLLAGNTLSFLSGRALLAGTRFDAAGQAQRLVTTGPFAVLRHPIAAGLGLLYLGLFLALPSWALLAGFGLFAVNLALRLPAEEAGLMQVFGAEYEAYRQRTGALWPRLHRS